VSIVVNDVSYLISDASKKQIEGHIILFRSHVHLSNDRVESVYDVWIVSFTTASLYQVVQLLSYIIVTNSYMYIKERQYMAQTILHI